jgi:release factor glutamine methyltransferase
MTIKLIQEKYLNDLNDIYPREEINSFFYMLCQSYLNKNRLDIALEPAFELTAHSEAAFLKALKALKKEYPIQYIIGKTEFMELPFEVNDQVLIPRPETEELISWIIASHLEDEPPSVLDIGTGSGCIAIVLAKQLSKSKIDAIDVSEQALEVAKRNAARNNIDINFIKTDILDGKELTNIYDIIVSNPPYVRESEKQQMHTNVLKYEPDLALFVSDNDPLLYYRHIAKLALNGLRPKGSLYFEINQYLGKDLQDLLETLGFEKIELKKDIYGADRMIRAVKN